MRMIAVLTLVLLFSLWVVGEVDANTLTDCKYLTNTKLTENTLPLKISSCEILHDLILERIKDNASKKELLKYTNQWVKNCTKTIEFDLLQP